MRAVRVEAQGTLLFTVGLRGGDVELDVADDGWVADGTALLRTIADYVGHTGRRLRIGETFGYGYWLVKFAAGGNGRLALWETTADGSGDQRGAALAMWYWRSQHEVCVRYAAAFLPPKPDQKVAVSQGVYDGETIHAVRYRAPTHMTGWYITAPSYNDDIRTLSIDHLYHLTAARPEIARYVALPPGFRFDTTSGEDVWFDAQVAAEAP
jgi:hypothetical protein